MKSSLSAAALLLFFFQKALPQCDVLNTLAAVNAASQLLEANSECTDAAGWTHYYHAPTAKLLLSIKKNGQNIGFTGSGLTVKAGTLAGYGGGGFNLSSADYIDGDIWIVANRYWQVTGASVLTAPVKVRFYMHGEDVSDIAESVDDFGFFVDEPEDLYVFTITGGGGLYPLATATQGVNASLTLYDMVPSATPDWSAGSLNGIPYAEFEVNTLDAGGGAGFLIFLQDEPLAVSGKILKTNNAPVPGATVQAATSSVGTTDAAGSYLCHTLLPGASYQIVPTKDTLHAEGISTVDLVAIARHLLGMELLGTPHKLIAADADKDAAIAFEDLAQIRQVLLGDTPNFPQNQSWRFVPKSYVFPNPANPFSPPFPESISAPNLVDTLFNQDFTGIKIGDVADESTAMPPALNTSFALPDLQACSNGDTVAFALTVQDFQGIRGFQFTLEWNPAVLDFLTASNFNLPAFNAESIGEGTAADGKLTFAWFNPNASGSSLANGAAVCLLKFVVSGSQGDASPLDFTGSLTPVLLLHQNLSEETPDFAPGSLMVDNNSLLTASAATQAAGCSGEPVGSIDLTVGGLPTPPLSFHWSNGAATEDLANLPGGEYRVTISDASGNCPLVAIFTVTPVGPLALTGSTTDMTCPTEANGMIDLDLAGGSPPFSFAWSNGAATEDLAGLFYGGYSVTATDAEGCSATASFAIENANTLVPNVSIMNATSATAANGAVFVNGINGGVPPFSFLWNTGAATQSLQNIPMGDYIVTITDGTGCEHVFGYLVNVVLTASGEAQPSQVQAALLPNPVPAGGQAWLALDCEWAGEAAAAVFSAEGKLVGREKFLAQAGRTFHALAAPQAGGVYFLQIQVGGSASVWVKMVVR